MERKQPTQEEQCYRAAHARELLKKIEQGYIQELLPYPNFVVWKTIFDAHGRPTKPPINPKTGQFADPTNPSEWGNYKEALRALSSGNYQGIGFVLSDNDPFTAIDMDECCGNNRSINAREKRYMEYFNSYTEYSPRGHGLHILVKGKLPDHNRKIGNLDMFSRGHYITLTLNKIPNAPVTIEPRQESLNKILEGQKIQADTLFIPPKIPAKNANNIVELKENAYYDYIDPKNTRYARLWNGDISDYPGKHGFDHSAADLAFCTMLLLKTNGNIEVTRELFLQSGLVRDKTLRQWGHSTYLDMTIKHALDGLRRKEE